MKSKWCRTISWKKICFLCTAFSVEPIPIAILHLEQKTIKIIKIYLKKNCFRRKNRSKIGKFQFIAKILRRSLHFYIYIFRIFLIFCSKFKIAIGSGSAEVAVQKKTIQVEKSEARQYLQLAQYFASCNRGVMPVLPVNTVPNIGIVLAYYWRRTGAVFFGSTDETLK